MIVPIISSIILVVSNITKHDDFMATFLSNKKAVDCRVVLGLSEELTDIEKDDESQILALIETETKSVIFKNIDQTMSVFTNDSLIIDSASGREWKGCNEIYDRYSFLTQYVSFNALQQNPIEINISENIATVETLSETNYDTAIVPYVGGGESNLQSKGKNRWTFVKYRDAWKLKTFVYNIPLNLPVEYSPNPPLFPP